MDPILCCRLEDPPIDRFRGDYEFLFNFYPVTVLYVGVPYPSVEHAYQAAKTMDLAARDRIRRCRRPSQAKQLGRIVKLRPDWEKIERSIMRELLVKKFDDKTYPMLAHELKATAPRQWIEGNTWGDRYWGTTQVFADIDSAFPLVAEDLLWEGAEGRHWKGDNWLGRLLMEVRGTL